MYTNGSYLAKQVVQVPEELIFNRDVQELLPVYMVIMLKLIVFILLVLILMNLSYQIRN